MTPRFLFTHGWATDGSLWDGIRHALHIEDGRIGSSVRELGYFGAPFDPAPTGSPTIAVGHSLGFMQMLGEPPSGLVGLVAINGFTRFSAASDHPAGVPCRLLHRMLRRLEQDPDTLAREFRSRCGLTAGLPAPARLPALKQGLELLLHGDFRQALRQSPPVLALSGGQDEIAPPALSEACFGAIEWVEAGHLLPLTHPALCARALRDFAGRLG
jgi:pimeloyl-[acyl-carrier protein] methyl ester esterase